MTPHEPPKPTPKLGKAQVRERRARKVTLTAALRQAAKAGQPVKAAEVYADHITLTFGEDEKKETVTPLEAWKAKRHAR
jgi:hypothetical protein